MATTYELAVQTQNGEWDHCGDFETREEAIEQANALASSGDAVFHDASGAVIFGLSDDPSSGHYEEVLTITSDEQTAYTLSRLDSHSGAAPRSATPPRDKEARENTRETKFGPNQR